MIYVYICMCIYVEENTERTYILERVTQHQSSIIKFEDIWAEWHPNNGWFYIENWAV